MSKKPEVPATIVVIDILKGGKAVECKTFQSDDYFGYMKDGKYRCALADTYAEACKNITFLCNQLLSAAPQRIFNEALGASGMYMPPEYDWSFIRDAEDWQKQTFCETLLTSPTVKKRIKGTFAEQIAKNIGLL